MKILLDTSAYSALLTGRDEVARRVKRASTVLLSAVVAGELLYGFHCGSRFSENLDRLEAFLDNPFVDLLPVTRATSDKFALVAAALRRAGKPIPTNDIWIAAHCMETGAELLSYDRHFQHVPGLAWTQLGT